MVDTEHEDLAAHRADLAGREVHDRDDGAAGELLGAVEVGRRPDDRRVPSGPKSMSIRYAGRRASGRLLAAHHGADPDVDPEELLRVNLWQASLLLARSPWQCIGRPILARDT